MIRGLLVGSALAFAASSSFAADLAYRKPSPAAPAVSGICKETKESALPADVFGFATGSDVANVGDWGIALDTAAAFGTRGGSLTSVTPVVQVSGSFMRCLEVGPFLMGSFSRTKFYDGTSSRTNGFGGGLEVKYKILGRATHGIGFTIAVTPSLASSSTTGAANTTTTGNSVRFLFDRQLGSNFYGAINLEFGQSWAASGGTVTTTSNFNVRAALSYQVRDGLFFGAEVSHQRAYNGQGLNRDQANAWFVGPNFLWAINDKWTLNGAWASQVSGSSKTSPGRALGIDNFNRHLARVKLGYAF